MIQRWRLECSGVTDHRLRAASRSLTKARKALEFLKECRPANPFWTSDLQNCKNKFVLLCFVKSLSVG